MKENLFIVDASNYLFRSYFAIRNMTNAEGMATNALFGFIRSIEKLIKDFDATNLIVTYDGKQNKKHRQEIYPAYKAHREGMDEDLLIQMGLSKKYLQYRGIPLLEEETAEADDLIGSIVHWAQNHYDHIYICSSDKDMFQLVTPKVSMLFTHKDNTILDPQGVHEKCGIDPDQMIDYLSLVGDSSDNIPGVKGFGPKTVASLLTKGRHLKDLIDDPSLIPPGKKRDTFIAEQQNAQISYQLATINIAFSVPHTMASYAITNIQENLLHDFYQQMSFSSLARSIKPTKTPSLKLSTVSFEEKQKRIKASSSPLIIAHMQNSSLALNIDTETILLTKEELTQLESNLFNNKEVITHNAKELFHHLYKANLALPIVIFDTMLAAYLINPTKNQYLPKDVLGPYEEALLTLPKNAEENPGYLIHILQGLMHGYPQLKKHVTPFEHLLTEIDIPLSYVLAQLEFTGIHLNPEILKKQSAELNKELQSLTTQIQELSNSTFNINSPKQLGNVLFEQLKIRYPGKKKQNGYETHNDILTELYEEHPIVPLIIKYRNLEKLRSTYVDALPSVINPSTKRIHPTFHQTKTATGRLSCSDPNLQNIPIRTAEGRKIRSAFTPKPEHVFISADYSQVELRILAHLSQDTQLIKAYKDNVDVHIKTAAALFKKPFDTITAKERSIAKTVNFAVIYGQQAFGLSKELGVSKKEATEWIEAYFKEYPEVKKYIASTIETATEAQGALSALGRWRPIADLQSKNSFLRSAAQRLAVNTPIQSLQSDIIKKAMLTIDKNLHTANMKSVCILQIHDELMFEVPKKEASELKKLIKNAMETAYPLSIPLNVEVYQGQNWEEC